MIPEEEFLKELEETFKSLTKLPVESHGSRTNPYYFCCNNNVYKQIKEDNSLTNVMVN